MNKNYSAHKENKMSLKNILKKKIASTSYLLKQKIVKKKHKEFIFTVGVTWILHVRVHDSFHRFLEQQCFLPSMRISCITFPIHHQDKLLYPSSPILPCSWTSLPPHLEFQWILAYQGGGDRLQNLLVNSAITKLNNINFFTIGEKAIFIIYKLWLLKYMSSCQIHIEMTRLFGVAWWVNLSLHCVMEFQSRDKEKKSSGTYRTSWGNVCLGTG